MNAVVTIVAGQEVGRLHVLRPGEECVLGRGRDAALRLRDPDASRRHALLLLAPRGLQVSDLGSENGTFVDGRRLSPGEVAVVTARGRLQVGAHALDLVVTGPGAGPRLHDELEVLHELGRGATGVVWAARHRATGREVAIKGLLPHVDHDGLRRRFLREAGIRVQSPHVVQLLDVRVDEGRVFIVMEWVRGGSVAQRVTREGRLPVRAALAVAEQAARGLAALHGADVVHRDVKPANLLLTPEGAVKVGDFGLAKPLDAQSLTASGVGLGSLAYAAPEQVEDAKWADPQADLYGLGATLYHLLAGRPPFVAGEADLLLQILRDAPAPLAALRPDCPAPVAALVDALLDKSPDARPGPALAVAERLRALAAAVAP